MKRNFLVGNISPSMFGTTFSLNIEEIPIENLRGLVFTDCTIENEAVLEVLRHMGVEVPEEPKKRVYAQAFGDTFYVILDQSFCPIWKELDPKDITLKCIVYTTAPKGQI